MSFPSEGLTPVVYNVTMTSADTEYSQALPANCRYFTISVQDGTTFRLAFVTGKVATPTAPWIQLLANQAYNSPEKMLLGPATTLYFACGSAGKKVQIIAWTA